METKVCTKCDKKYDATLEFWHKQKIGKYGLRSICKVCVRNAHKEYRKDPKVKEIRNHYQVEWRALNTEKSREISKRCYDKNSIEINSLKREKYKKDPEYKAKILEIERKYVESGRRHEMNSKPEIREKARVISEKRRLDPEKKEHDNNVKKQWREDNKEYLDELHKNYIKELFPSYVACSMRIKVSDLTPEILETKKIIIQLKRELKNNNVKIR
jgi:hypothetical protein